MRFEKEINIYSDEAIIKRFKANETSVSVVQGKISALISESELVELQNSKATMYSKLASAVMDIKSLTLNFSDLTTKYNTVSGQYTALDSKVTEYKVGVDGLSANITNVQQNLKNNYSTTTAMNTAIEASANEVSAQISAVKTTLQNDYSTTAAMNSAIKAKVDELSLSVSSSYTKKSELTAAQNRISALETWKNEAQFKITDSAIISTVTNSSAYKTSVNSLIEQKADSIRLKADKISWKSTYSSMSEYGTLNCQNATIKGTLYSENGKDKVYLKSGRMQIFYNNQELGLIGGNGWNNINNIEGLNFDLEYTGDYMTWAAQDAEDSTYKTKLTYARTAFAGFMGNALNVGCDIDMRNWTLHNVSWPDGGITSTINYVQILEMNSDGTVARWGNNGMMRFKNGILVDLSYY